MQSLFLKRYIRNKIKAYTHTEFLKIFGMAHKQKDKNATEIPALKPVVPKVYLISIGVLRATLITLCFVLADYFDVNIGYLNLLLDVVL